MTTRSTQQMTGATMSMTMGAALPSRSTLAARSLAAVDRIADPKARFDAFSRHMDEFPPLIASY